MSCLLLLDNESHTIELVSHASLYDCHCLSIGLCTFLLAMAERHL